MSQENVEIVRRALGGMSQNVAEHGEARASAVESLAPGIEFEEDPRFPEARTYRGRGAFFMGRGGFEPPTDGL
jgi:hypothetical protein